MRVRSWLAARAAIVISFVLVSSACPEREVTGDACLVEPLGYDAIDGTGRAWYATDRPVGVLLRGCASAVVLDDAGKVLARSPAGRIALPVSTLSAGSHTLVFEAPGGRRSRIAVSMDDSGGALSVARADDERARAQQHGDDARLALETWAQSADLPSGQRFPSLAARRLRNAAYFAHRLRDFARMASLIQRSETEVMRLPDSEGRASLTYYRGLLALERLDTPGAHALFEAAAQRAEELGLRSVANSALEAQGMLLERTGRFEASLHAFGRARTVLAELASDSSARSRDAINTSWVQLRWFEADPQPARLALAERALASALELASEPTERADAAANLAWLALRAGRPADVERLVQVARSADPHGHSYGAPYWPWLVGEAALQSGERRPARRAFEEMIELVRSGQAPVDLGWLAQASLAQLAADAGHTSRALEGFRAATRALFERSREVGGSFGRLAFALGQRPLYERALAFFVAGGHHDDALRLVQQVLRMRRPTRARVALPAASVARYDALVSARFETAQALARLASQEGLIPGADEARRRAEVDVLRARDQALAGQLVALTADTADAPPPGVAELVTMLHANELLVIDQAAASRLYLTEGRAFRSADGVASVAQESGAAHVLLVNPFEASAPTHATALETELVTTASLSRVDDLRHLSARPPLDTGLGRAVVIADSRGDLPYARREGAYFGALLSAKSLLGLDATRNAVLSALAESDYAHIAGHAEARPFHPAGDVLVLAAGSYVSALDVAHLVRVPAVVVLGTCRDRIPNATEPASAELPDAFLDAGARLVISARRRAGDAESERFLSRYGAALLRSSPRDAQREASASLRADGDAAWDLFYLRGVP